MIREDIAWKDMDNERRHDALVRVSNDYYQAFLAQKTEREERYYQFSLLPAALKCVDSRPHLPKYTRRLEGEIHPTRGIGGRFTPGLPSFRHHMLELINFSESLKLRNCVFFVLAHYSKSNPKLCCAGQDHDRDQAIRYALKLTQELKAAYRAFFNVVFIPLVLETDAEEVAILSAGGESIGATTYNNKDQIHELYPELIQHPNVVSYLEGMLLDNQQHVRETAGCQLKIANEHCEFLLGIGKRMLWVPRHRGLIVNDFDLRDKVFTKTVDIIKSVFDAGKIGNGWILLVSTSYFHRREFDSAVAQTNFLRQLADKVIQRHNPEFHSIMLLIPVVVEWNTMKVTFLR